MRSAEKFQARFRKLVESSPPDATTAWSMLSEYLSGLHDDLDQNDDIAFLLPESLAIDDWVTPFTSVVTEGVNEVSLPFDDSFWHLKSSPSYLEKATKILHYSFHPRQFLLSKPLPGGKHKPPLRSFDQNQFNQVYLLMPLLEFQWQELHQLLVFYAIHMVQIQKATKILKDDLLHTVGITSRDAYWSAVNGQKPGDMIKQFIAGMETVKDEIRKYRGASLARLLAFSSEQMDRYNRYKSHAGTFLLPRYRYTGKMADYVSKTAHKRLVQFRKSWISHLEAVKDGWQKDLEITILQLQIAVLRNETGELISQKSEGKILPGLNLLQTRLMNTRQEIPPLDSTKPEGLHEKLLHLNRNLLKQIRQNELNSAVETLSNAHLSRIFRGFISRVSEKVENLAERHIILKDPITDRFIPRTTPEEVMLKEIVQEEIVLRTQKANEKQIAQIGIELDAITRTVSTIDEVIDFNFKAAIDLIRQDSSPENAKESIQTAMEAVDRTIGLLKDVQERYVRTISNGLVHIDYLALDLEEGIQALGDNEQILELKLRMTRARTMEKIRNWRHTVWQIVVNIVPKILKTLRTYLDRLTSGYRKVRRISGMGPVDETTGFDLSGYLRDEQIRIRRLPFIYQKLFQIAPLDDQRFFFGRNKAMERIRTRFDAFKDEETQITAVISEKGNGKTTLLNFARQTIFKGYPVISLQAGHTISTVPEFYQLLQSGFKTKISEDPATIESELINGPRRIIVLEDIHNLFLRTIDGLSVIETVIKLLAVTKEKIFWIITSGLYGWKLLDYMVNLSDFFTEVIELENLNENDLENLILRRHDMSGFRLHFLVPDELVDNRSFKRLKTDTEKQNFLRQRFFGKLKDNSAGNIKTALIEWMSVISYTRPEEPINVNGIFDFDPGLVYLIKNEDLYYLAAFIQHEFLTMNEFASVFRLTPSHAKLILSRLTSKGYLRIQDQNFEVPPRLYHSFVNILKQKNILY
jgi:hypothetical protein